MKFFVCIIVAFIALLSHKSLAAPVDDVVQAAELNAEELDGEENLRFKKSAASGSQTAKSAYGVAPSPQQPGQALVPGQALLPGQALSYSYHAPAPVMPCARNLLFSCQPSVAPVPCAAPPAPAPLYSVPAPQPSSGYAGAYSEPIPQWAAAPQYAYPTVREVMYGY